MSIEWLMGLFSLVCMGMVWFAVQPPAPIWRPINQEMTDRIQAGYKLVQECGQEG